MSEIFTLNKFEDASEIVKKVTQETKLVYSEYFSAQCGNKEHSKMNVTRRTCGYLGENFWNVGKTKEINSRVLHI